MAGVSRGPARSAKASLPAALMAAVRGRATGALVHVAGGVTRTVWLREGNPVFADSTDPNEALGAYLAFRGAITETGRVMMEAELGRPNVREEQAVIDSGLLGPSEVLELLRDSFEERLVNAFGAPGSAWTFEARALPPDMPTFEFPAGEALLRGVRERYTAERLALEFPIAANDRYAYQSSELAKHPKLVLDKDEVRLAAVLDGVRGFDAAVAESGVARTRAHAALYALALLEIVEYVAASKAASTATATAEASKAIVTGAASGAAPAGEGAPPARSIVSAGRADEMRARAAKELPDVLEIPVEAAVEVVAAGFKALIGKYDLGRAHWLPEADRAAALLLLDRAIDAYLVMTQAEARAKYFATPPWDREVAAAGLAARLSGEKHYVKAGIFMVAGNHLAAEAALLPALQLSPRDARFHLRMGICIYLRSKAKGDPNIPNGAARALEKAAAFNPKSDEAWLYLGHIAMTGGDRARALECYQHALALNPSSNEARRGVMRAEGNA